MHQKAAVAAPGITAPEITTHAVGPTMAAPDTAVAPGAANAPEGGTSATQQKGATPLQLRSALKRAGQKKHGRRVIIDESKNKCLEADYVILVHDESEPQLVSIRSFDLSLGGVGAVPPAGGGTVVEQLTLSPPEGYKDCFTHALHEHLQDESDSDVSSIGEVLGHSSECPARANLPDLVNHRGSSSSSQSNKTKLTVENVRHHEQLMKGNENTVDKNEENKKVVKTGILKGGKHWKNGDGRKNMNQEVEEDDQRRSVRFSGQDEYSMLDNIPLDSIPLDAANSAALAKFMPKLRELGVLLGEDPQDWHVELSPLNPDVDDAVRQPEEEPLETEIKQLPPPMDDEAIGESMQRYDEMRRRIAAAEGRDNTSVCSDESKSSSDSQSSDSTMTETRIRRIENNDAAHMAGGIMRSNSEVRRAIERNALRRSLTRFTDARKKENNKNDKTDKGETSLLEKLRWLTASEDATNGNSEHKDDDEENNKEAEEMEKNTVDPKIQDTISQYRKLAEMFNKTTSLRGHDIVIPADVREWKMQEVIFPEQKARAESRQECIGESSSSGSTTPTVFQAVPAMSIGESVSGDDDECDKLIYSGGVRYTREGTLPQPNGEEPPDISPSVPSDVRKQFLSQMTGSVAHTNGIAVGHPRERSSLASNSDSYTLDDIDEALVDDHSSSVPSSSQSSPRLSGGSARSDMDGTSTTESGYSSQETNGEHVPFNTLVVVDELAEFVRKDAGRMERLRRRYDSGEPEDHGFNRRPSVRGIKARFGSTTDLLKQMANQLAPPAMAQPGYAGSHMTWPYREVGTDDDTGPPPRRRAAANRANVLPALQEDAPYTPASVDLSPQMTSSNSTTQLSLANTRAPRVVHVYASTGDLRAPPPSRIAMIQESQPPDLIRPVGAPPPRALSHTSLNLMNGSQQSLIMAPMVSTAISQDPHYQCRRPASVHGHLPQDSLVMRGAPPPPQLMSRPHSTLGQYPVSSTTRMPEAYHVQEERLPQRAAYESGHQPLAQRGSYPGTFPSGPQYPTPPQYANPPPYHSSLPQYPNPPVDNTGSLPRQIPQQYHHHPQLQQQQQLSQHQQLPQHQQFQQHQQHQQQQPSLPQHQQQHSHIQQLPHALPHQHQHIPIQLPPHQQQQLNNLSQCSVSQVPPHIHSHQPVPSPRTSVSYVRSVPPASISHGIVMSQGGMVHQCGAPQSRVSSVSCVSGQPWSQSSIPTSQFHPAYLPPPMSSHMSYTTPIVPESGVSRLPPPPSGGMPILNGSIGKLEGIRDERGVPEGASSSPRGVLDPPPQQFGAGAQISPTREPGMLHRQMSMT